MAGKIFINYRRGDDPQAAGRLFDRLQDAFDPEQIFLDVDNIPPGVDFVRVLHSYIAACDVVLALIGKGWIEARDQTGARRLDNPDDFVRVELVSALNQDKRVIPVLIGEVHMPRSDELPDPLKPLTRRNAVRLTHERFRSDVEGLVRALKLALKEIDAERQAAEKKQAERTTQIDRDEAAASGPVDDHADRLVKAGDRNEARARQVREEAERVPLNGDAQHAPLVATNTAGLVSGPASSPDSVRPGDIEAYRKATLFTTWRRAAIITAALTFASALGLLVLLLPSTNQKDIGTSSNTPPALDPTARAKAEETAKGLIPTLSDRQQLTALADQYPNLTSDVTAKVQALDAIDRAAAEENAAKAATSSKKVPSAITIENHRTVALKALQIAMPGSKGKVVGKLVNAVAGGKSARSALNGARGCEYDVKWEFEDATDESTADLCNDPRIVLTD
jgi:hypothetical protein